MSFSYGPTPKRFLNGPAQPPGRTGVGFPLGAISSGFGPPLPPLSRRGPRAGPVSGAQAGPAQQQQQQQGRPQGPNNLNIFQQNAQRRDLLRHKRRITSRFQAWHRGLQHWVNWNDRTAFFAMQQMRIPIRLGIFPGFNPPPQRYWYPPLAQMLPPAREGQGQGGQPQPGRRRAIGGMMRRWMGRVRRRNNSGSAQAARPSTPVPPDPRDVRAEALEATMARDFKPVGFKFRKRLGAGGQGAAYLLDMVADDGRKVPIVAKASIRSDINGDSGIRDEKNAMMAMSGARHIMQRVVMQDLPYPPTTTKSKAKDTMDAMFRAFGRVRLGRSAGQPPPPLNAEERMRQARRDIDQSNDIIVMEYMARGSVQEMIENMAAKGRALPDRALWMIMECLFKSCIAMAYPFLCTDATKDLTNATHAQQDEVVPRQAGYMLPEQPFVHFDLDPQNALISEFGPSANAHTFMPTVKVADLGLAHFINQDKRNSETIMWSLRQQGKSYIFMPEQFTEEWEYEASIDLAHLQQEETAGNYQWWSNLYQVGWIMWSLMTHAYPTVPPTMDSYDYLMEDLPNGIYGQNYLVQGLTYGGQLMSPEFNQYDLELRQLVMRLLDHTPEQRPKMPFLEQLLRERARRRELSVREPDAEFMQAMQDIFEP